MKRAALVLIIAVAFGALLLKKKGVSAPAVLPTTDSSLSEVKTPVASQKTAVARPSTKIASATMTPAPRPMDVPPVPTEETPKAVLDWSTDLGRGMLGSFRDPAKADKMFSFLRNCAEDQSLAMTYRAVCAGNAKRLADRFPDRFAQNYGGFQRGLPGRIQEFLAQAYTNF